MASYIVALSAQVDHELSLLLVRIIGASERAALAMFDELDSQRTQLRLLKAAAKAKLGAGSEQYRVFQAVLKTAEVAQADRHRLAHWIWGHCPELPDALLLADPRAVRSQVIALTRLREKRKSTWLYVLGTGEEERKQDDLQIGKLEAPDKDRILVYGHADLQQALRDLSEAMIAVGIFQHYLEPMKFTGTEPPDPEIAHLGTSDGVLRRLNSLRLFREAFDREKDSSDPSSTPQSPPS